jgi:uncharacterized protein (DUF885 family)
MTSTMPGGLKMTREWLLLGCVCLAAACATSDSKPEDASARLSELGDEIWNRRLEKSPEIRLRLGLPVERLPELTYQEAEDEARFYRSVLDRATTIDADDLSHNEVVTLETLRWESAMNIEGLQYFWLRNSLTPYASPLRALGQLFPALPLQTAEDLDRYLALLAQASGYIAQIHELARGQSERGIVVSRQNLPAAIGLVRASIRDPEEGMFSVAKERLAGFDEAQIEAFRGAITARVREEINPAFESLAAFLEGPYAEQAPEGIGISQYPNGRDYYLYLVRLNTTMDVTPEDVQQVGYEMLAEFQKRMAEIRDEIGFDGTREEFHKLLRTDPRFFPETADEVAERLQSASDSMWTRIGEYFTVTPKAPYGVKRLLPELEPAMTYGYYNPPNATEPTGYYNYNGSKLDERTWLGLAAISLHELIPGHHFQIARQQENEALPTFRKDTYYTAYGEGWGSYSSFLGLEADMFEDPYSRYGLYILESFLATRLVVDPGMNYFGMSLEEARQFMRENTLESETQIFTESLRYSTDIPGQALGYQMGKRGILELRREAESALGDSFDIRLFHETVLADGSVPMVVLEQHIDRFIEREQTRRR